MKRYIYAAVLLLLSLTLMASCTSNGGAASSVPPSSSQPDSVTPVTVSSAMRQGNTTVSENGDVSISSVSDSATADPIAFAGHFSPDAPPYTGSSVLNLDTDGSFHLTVNLLDRMGNLYGTYTLEGNMVRLNVTERDFGDSYVNANTNPILFTVVDIDTLTWESAYLGDTLTGDIFYRC